MYMENNKRGKMLRARPVAPNLLGPLRISADHVLGRQSATACREDIFASFSASLSVLVRSSREQQFFCWRRFFFRAKTTEFGHNIEQGQASNFV